MSVVVSRGYAWIAEQDGIAHAHPARGRRVRTLCGRPAIDERYGRPTIVRCARCIAVADGAAS